MKVNLSGRFQFLFPSVMLFVSLLFPAFVAGQVPLIQFGNSSGIVYQNTVTVRFPQPQNAGDLNIVVVGWNDGSSTIASVTDSIGNNYVLAAGVVATPLPASASVSQAIYYAKNIVAAPTNDVTVVFNSNTGAQDVRIVEYGTSGGGLDPVSPLDVSAGASATADPASSGPATTNSANDLIFGAGTITTGFTSRVISCGPGCTMFGEPNPPNPTGINGYGDIVEDALVSAVGTYQAAADLNSGAAVMQMVAMRLSGQTLPVFPAPTASQILPNTSPEAGGVAIAITGANFVPGATVMFSNGIINASAVNCAVASATTINCVSPAFPTGTTPTVVVTNVDGQATTPGLPFTYTNSVPFSTAGTGSISPTGGATNGGTVVTITGSDFAPGATVVIGGGGGINAEKVQIVNSTTILATFPAGSAGNPSVEIINPSGQAGDVPGGYGYSTGAGINFIQANASEPLSPTASSQVSFNLPQTAGDLNVVVAGWGDTSSSVTSVSDSAGNTYAVAAAPVQGTSLSQVIYYAKNINAAANNTVTIAFNQTPASPDFRIVEYSGLDTVNPLDAGGGAAGTGTDLDSGAINLTSPGDLFIGAADVAGVVTSPGGGFATAILTKYGNNVEHTFPTAAGAFDATATQDVGVAWVMQGVGFRQPAGTLPGFTVAATTPATVNAGSSTTSTVTVTPSGGFTNAVALTCTGLPTGATCAPLSLTPGGSSVSGTLTITTTSATPAGTSTVTVTGTSGSTVNTTTISLSVTVVGAGSFTLAAANPTAQTVAPGGSASSTITLTGSGGYTGTVNLTCSVSPVNSPPPVCSLPASVNLSATVTSASATLSITTTAATASIQHSSSIFYAMFLPLAGMTLLGVSFGSRRKKILGILLVCLMASGLLFLASCSSGSSSSGGGGGGGNPGTPAGTYTITVTATPTTGTAQTTPFTLTVN